MEPLEIEEPVTSNFLSCFWELASEDFIRRRQATESIVQHLKESCEISNTPVADLADGSYTLKRLIRGLSSSREFARQGFSVCLCEIIRSFNDFDISSLLNMIDDGTKVTGSMKGIEEREMIFGKLFGYVAVIRSERLTNNKPLQFRILTTLIELYNGKGWIKEVVTECILAFLNQFNVSEFTSEIMELLKSIFENIMTPQDMSIDQLLLTYGLQHLQSVKNKGSELQLTFDFLPVEDIYSVASLNAISPILIENGASGYPKIHSVWKYVLGGIFGLNENRDLPAIRCKVLDAIQEELLTTLVTLIDTEFLTSSQEKRSVAFYLFEQLMAFSPAELIPLSLSQSCVRCLLSTRQNKKHTLYSLAGITLQNMRDAVGGSSVVRLAMASVIVQYGGANFDSNTNTTTITSLLEGLSSREIITHIKFLCDVLSKEYQAINSNIATTSTTTNTINPEQEEEGEEEEEQQHHLTAVSTIQALASIIKNSKLPQRGDIITIATAILLRLACFHTGITTIPVTTSSTTTATPKKEKKKSKKVVEVVTSTTTTTTLVTTDILEVINIIELGVPYPKEVTALAASKLLSALSDIGNISITSLNTPPSPPTTLSVIAVDSTLTKPENGTNKEKINDSTINTTTTTIAATNNENKTLPKNGVTVMDTVLEITSTILNSKITFLKDISTNQLQLEDDLDEVAVSGADIFKSIYSIIQQLKSFYDKDNKQKIFLHFSSLLSHSFYLTLTVDSLELQTLQSLCESVYLFFPQIVQEKKTINKQLENDEDDEDSSSAQQLLLECCLEFLSIPVDTVFKGIRDSMKSVWSSLLNTSNTSNSSNAAITNPSTVIVVEEEVMTQLALVVLDQQDDNEGEGEGEVEDASQEEDEEDDNDEKKEEEVAVNNKSKKRDNIKEKKPDVSSNKEKEKEVEEDDDILITMDNAMSMLEDDDDFEDEDGTVAHFAAADQALVEMIKQRKLTRKEGLMNACKCELLHRTRALDLLEIMVQKVDAAGPILALYVPFLECVKKIETSAIMKDLAEAKSFIQKLFAFLESKFSKKKLLLSIEDQDAVELLVSLPGLLSPYLRNNNSTLKLLAATFFLSVTRLILHSHTITTNSDSNSSSTNSSILIKEMTDSLTTTLSKLVTDYFQIKNSKISLKVIDEILLRFTDNNSIILPTVLPVILQACSHSKTEFLSSEAYRILMSVLKHYRSLSRDMKKFMNKSLKNIITVLKEQLMKVSNDNNSKNKRLIIAIQCVRELVVLLKSIVKNTGDDAGHKYLENNHIVSSFIDAISNHTVTPTTCTQSKIIQQNIEALKSLQTQFDTTRTTGTTKNDDKETIEKSQKKKKDKKNKTLENIPNKLSNTDPDNDLLLINEIANINLQENKVNKKRVDTSIEDSTENNISSEQHKKKKKKKEKKLAENL